MTGPDDQRERGEFRPYHDTEEETMDYRDDDRTVGFCPQCGEECTSVSDAGSAFCSEHGKVMVEWDRPEPRQDPATLSDVTVYGAGSV